MCTPHAWCLAWAVAAAVMKPAASFAVTHTSLRPSRPGWSALLDLRGKAGPTRIPNELDEGQAFSGARTTRRQAWAWAWAAAGGAVATAPPAGALGLQASEEDPGFFSEAYDAVGRWLTNHPAPLWLVNNPAKKWVATRSAGNYDREVVRSTLASLVGEDAVVVFSATYCPFSLAAKRTLAAQGVQFKVIEWNKRDDGAALVAELGELTGRTSIPHIFLGGLSIGGFNDGTPGLRPLISSGGFGGALEQARRRRAAGKARQVAIFGQAREEGA